jgi:Reverse transcriptase (RNA-dependent DNA polymerase)
MQEEVDSLLAYSTFEDKGHINFIPGYKNIHVHFVFAVKHDLRHKACLVAGGHLNDPNTTDSKFSSVVSLRSKRIAIAAGELNNVFLMVGDISSAYLEAFTLEKVTFIGCPEFGLLAGHLLIIVRALYGLRTSGARWHDLYADVMCLMGFSPCKADPDVWMRDCTTHYEYVLC